jgi:pyridoxamine 5'-phosphate oxidase
MKGLVNKTSEKFNQNYFEQRSHDKNALAISSNQSKAISTYGEVVKKYNDTKLNLNLDKCPDYWGGFYFRPYEIEFWEGKKFRLNKRDLYILEGSKWTHSILQP